MSNYNKHKLTTELQFHIKDPTEWLDYNLPTPNSMQHPRGIANLFIMTYYLDGYFGTKKAIETLNDILARFYITFDFIELLELPKAVYIQHQKRYQIKDFQNLKSIPAKQFKINKTDTGLDAIFIAIKYQFVEPLLRKETGKIIPYQSIEQFAFNHFVDTAKDKSTLRAKCRSIWNYYNNKGWVADKRQRKTKTKEELMATRKEQQKKLSEMKVNQSRAKVKGAIESLKFMNEKVTVRKIAEYANISTRTVSKYYKDFL